MVLFDQMLHPTSDDQGLSRPWSRQYKLRPVLVPDRIDLTCVNLHKLF